MTASGAPGVALIRILPMLELSLKVRLDPEVVVRIIQILAVTFLI